MAHKKGASSTRNGRDSNSQRLGVKRLFALVEGHVEFGTKRGRRVVNVTPPAEATTSVQ